MLGCGNRMKRVFVAIVLVALIEPGSAVEKHASCCTQVTRGEVTHPILGYLVQDKSPLPCVKAVILQTENGLFCIHPRARWLNPKIKAFEKARRQSAASPSVSPSPVSLLSIITSAASSPLSTSARPSISSTPETPADENTTGQNQ